MDIESKYKFDSEHCSVCYISEYNVVFLQWKKFSCGDDYRKPALFALSLLEKFKESNFIFDARNGFEDEKEDVEWGFNVFLPRMSKTTCKNVVYILNKVCDIEEEMSMWHKEFGKYFNVKKVFSFEEAISCLKQEIK